MGLLDKMEEIAGTVAGVEGLKKVDSNAGILAEGAAAIAGFEGVEAIKERLEKKDENQQS